MLYGGSIISDYSSTLGLRASTQTRRLHALAACCGNHKQLLWEPLTVHAPQTHPHPLNLNRHLYMHAIIHTVHTVHAHMRCNKYILYGNTGSTIYKHIYQLLQVLPKLLTTKNNNIRTLWFTLWAPTRATQSLCTEWAWCSIQKHLIEGPTNDNPSYLWCPCPNLIQLGITKNPPKWVVIDVAITTCMTIQDRTEGGMHVQGMLLNHKEQSPNSITIHKLITGAVQLSNCLESVLSCRSSQLKRKITSNRARTHDLCSNASHASSVTLLHLRLLLMYVPNMSVPSTVTTWMLTIALTIGLLNKYITNKNTIQGGP